MSVISKDVFVESTGLPSTIYFSELKEEPKPRYTVLEFPAGTEIRNADEGELCTFVSQTGVDMYNRSYFSAQVPPIGIFAEDYESAQEGDTVKIIPFGLMRGTYEEWDGAGPSKEDPFSYGDELYIDADLPTNNVIHKLPNNGSFCRAVALEPYGPSGGYQKYYNAIPVLPYFVENNS